MLNIIGDILCRISTLDTLADNTCGVFLHYGVVTTEEEKAGSREKSTIPLMVICPADRKLL